MLPVDTVVVYDATERLSPRHIMRRNGEHVAVCGARLQPWGRFRTLDGLATDRDRAEATCRPCLRAHAEHLVLLVHRRMPPSVTLALGRVAPDGVERKIEVLLAGALAGSSLTVARLIQEHFPRELVERAEVLAEIREEE